MAIASFFVAIVLAHTLGSVDRLPQFWQSVPGVPVLAVIAHLVSAASDRSERAAARERTLSRSGLALALADDEESVRNVGLSSVVQLLEGVPGVHVEMSLGTAPTPRTGSQVSYVLPLESRDGRMGVLTITADRDLPPETHDALDVLRTQITLSLQNVSLTTTLRHEATHDRLTGLANRTLMELHLEKSLRDQPDRTCVLLMDLDGFKQVNDVYGHAAGDDLLRVVSRRIRTTVGDGGLVARLGGDEFVVVLDDAGHDVAAVAQRLIDAVSEPVELAIATVSVGASAGVAPGGHGSTVGAMLREADNAMYAAKRGGRGRFTISRRVRSGGKLPAQAGQL
jgi:diguanylate cyclase (GGDEF)-like protein